MHRLLLMSCISTVLTISEAANVAKRSMECAKLEQCPTYKLGLEIAASLSLPDEKQYKQLCRKNDELQKCFDDNKDDCEDDPVLNNVMRGAEALNFICSAEGKEGLDSISGSPCVNNQTTLPSAQIECVKSYHYYSSLYTDDDMSIDEETWEVIYDCLYFNHQKTCILESLKNLSREIRSMESRLVPLPP
ncbi:hypothetical protein Bpfe_023884 [Biomphalaria pfeifferi]|uniref:DUF19 domain-containing protein n=1 Tax=Biomphalaria pfeifferi TaxID=112525 RepID=A0AAD8B270_BIOPF|nr:hypothetical protein Bpfe_023884 [Biomphalaria pfeifferi]